MPQLRCPSCDKLLSIPDKLAGKAGQCPGCKSRIAIPPLKSKPRAEDDEADEEEEAPPRHRRNEEGKPDRRITAKRPGGRRDEDDDEDDEDRPTRRTRSRDDEEDEDDRPKTSIKRSRDEDDRPSRRRSRDEEEEDEDAPPRRRAARDERPRRRRRRRRSEGAGWASPTMLTLYVGGGILFLCCALSLVVPALAIVPVGLGYLLLLGGGVWFLIVAFRDDVMQGILCWFIPFYSLYYLLTHFDEEKYPFYTQLAGFALIIIGGCAGGAGAGVQGR